MPRLSPTCAAISHKRKSRPARPPQHPIRHPSSKPPPCRPPPPSGSWRRGARRVHGLGWKSSGGRSHILVFPAELVKRDAGLDAASYADLVASLPIRLAGRRSQGRLAAGCCRGLTPARCGLGGLNLAVRSGDGCYSYGMRLGRRRGRLRLAATGLKGRGCRRSWRRAVRGWPPLATGIASAASARRRLPSWCWRYRRLGQIGAILPAA